MVAGMEKVLEKILFTGLFPCFWTFPELILFFIHGRTFMASFINNRLNK